MPLPLVALVLAAPPAVPPGLEDWTPLPVLGKAEPWQKTTDKDWIDPRLRQMDTGPFLNATFRYPVGTAAYTVTKGTAVKVGDGGVLFDRNVCRIVCGWTGGWLTHSDRRFGLLNTPTPAGKIVFAVPPEPTWANPQGTWDTAGAGKTAPLPATWVNFGGIDRATNRVTFDYRVGNALVFESASLDPAGGLRHEITVATGKVPAYKPTPGSPPVTFPTERGWFSAPLGQPPTTPTTVTGGGNKARWGEPIVTKFVRGDEAGPFAVDTLTLPYDNRFRALWFCGGLDFLPDGRVAVCTAHGDVWLGAIDEKAGTVAWKRFATGLYHPLGLKVVDGQVCVLERGQLTRLHDRNADDEADYFECVSHRWDTGKGEHSYDMNLETDPAGNFYFFKTGDTDLPTGGCLLRVGKDGGPAEVFATGFRHPLGMGMSPTGIVTGADQQGNWMPATRIDQYTKGGFYGDMRAHHRSVPPKTYDPPVCWVPHEIDNSAGGQVWVPEGKFGPLGGLPLHLSYGRCKAFVLLRDEYPGGVQGGVADLGLRFLSGSCRARFHPDGSMYVCGLNGWQTAAKADGSVQRVRYTGKPLDVPVGLKVVSGGVELTFPRPLDKTAVADLKNYRVAWWNYRWAATYGSKRWKPSAPDVEGLDEPPVTAATLSADGKTLRLTVAGMAPVMQMQVGYRLTTATGTPAVGSVYLTANKVP